MGVVYIEGPANVQSVSVLHNALSASIGDGLSTTLDIARLEDADLSFLQLVESARLEASRHGTDFRLAQPANAFLAALLKRAGFVGGMGAADREFWFHGEFPQ